MPIFFQPKLHLLRSKESVCVSNASYKFQYIAMTLEQCSKDSKKIYSSKLLYWYLQYPPNMWHLLIFDEPQYILLMLNSNEKESLICIE